MNPDRKLNSLAALKSKSWLRSKVRWLNAAERLEVKAGSKNEFLVSDEAITLVLRGLTEGDSGSAEIQAFVVESETDDTISCFNDALETVVLAKAYSMRDAENYFYASEVVHAIKTNDLVTGLEGVSWLCINDRSQWHFAPVLEYNSATNYRRNEIVIVSADNAAVTSEDAVAGVWVLRGLAQDGGVNYPVWPMPNADPDHADNHWLLIGLYPYPTRGCDSEGEEVYCYAQRTPWQTEEITLLDD